MMQNDKASLQTIFSEAIEVAKKAEAKPRGDERQSLYIESRRMFEKAGHLIESLDLFSDNETIDDIATSDIKYLTVPAHLARILLSLECIGDRVDLLTKAEAHIVDFLRRVSHYGLGSVEIETALKCSDELTPRNTPTSSSYDLNSAMQSRNEKIEKYRRSQKMISELSDLEKRIELGISIDDEVLRNYHILQLRRTIEESLDSLNGEVRPALHLERNRTHQNRSPDQERPVRDPKTTNSSLSTMTIVKNDLQKRVFGLGYPSRPTITVDEFINKKIEDGSLAFNKHEAIYGNSLQRYAEKPNLLREQEEHSDIEHEEKEEREDPDELKRKRQWDEFKDETPRGSGNRHNMG